MHGTYFHHAGTQIARKSSQFLRAACQEMGVARRKVSKDICGCRGRPVYRQHRQTFDEVQFLLCMYSYRAAASREEVPRQGTLCWYANTGVLSPSYA